MPAKYRLHIEEQEIVKTEKTVVNRNFYFFFVFRKTGTNCHIEGRKWLIAEPRHLMCHVENRNIFKGEQKTPL